MLPEVVRAGLAPSRVTASPAASTAMRRLHALTARVAPSSISVLILGECGVGKDVLAQMIHRLSPRANKPFLAVNCASISEALMAAELFGHERGAFTGASSQGKVGLLESAQGGTVFLDEIGDMSLSMQATLLRVIETREVRPVMATRSRSINVRFVAATNKDLKAAVKKGAFRLDLLHRLNTMTLSVPPLRERVDEIPALAVSFAEAAWSEGQRDDKPTISAEAMDFLRGQHWPGNIRELKNVIERAVALTDEREIRLEHLIVEGAERDGDAPQTADILVEDGPIALGPVKQAEKQRIVAALARCNGNQTRAAVVLGLCRRTLVAKLDEYRIPRPRKGLALVVHSATTMIG